MSMRKLLLLLVAVFLVSVGSPAMADVVSWQGINSDGATAMTDNDVDTLALWYNEDLAAPAVALPDASDVADFYMDATVTDYADEMFIRPTAALAPGSISVGNTAYNHVTSPLYILKDLSLANLNNYWYNGGTNMIRIGAVASGGWMKVPQADTDPGEMTGVLTIKSDILPGGATTIDITGLDTRALVAAEINLLNATTGVTAVATGWSAAIPNSIVITRDATGVGKYLEVTTTGLFATTRSGGAVTRGDGYDAAATTLTMTGATDPISFDLRYGYWGSMSLAAGAKIVCDNAAISFTQQSQSCSSNGVMMGEAGSSVEFTAVAGSVDLADPGSRLDGNIGVGHYVALKVRSDQTWTSNANAFINRRAPEVALVEAIDALPLDNMDQVNFVVTHSYPNNGTPDTTLPEGEYGSLAMYGYWHYSTNRTQVTLTGDVAFLGEAVERNVGPITGVGVQMGGTDNASDMDYGFRLVTAGFDLDVTNGITIANIRAGGTYDNDYDDGGAHDLIVEGSTVSIGGDLTLLGLWGDVGPDGQPGVAGVNDVDDPRYPGLIDEAIELMWPGSDDIYAGSYKVGIYGDATTVINLGGSFVSEVQTRGSLVDSTLNMLGGSSGSPVTMEVCSSVAAGADFTAGTGAYGVLQIGAAGDEAYVQLVDDELNDDKYGVAGEVLLAKTLNIVNGQLDLNAQSVLVSNTTLSIGADGILDLAAGVDQVPGVPYTAFAGVGDQTATWDTFKDKVVDNSTIDNQTLTFTSFYDGVNDRTLWKPIGVATGIVSADSAVSATPDSLPALGLSTVQIVLVDTGGWPIVSLVDADFTVGITNSGTKASVVTETVAGVSGVYTFQVTDGVVETVDVDVQVDAGAGDVALNTEPSIDFISVTIETANSSVAYASGAPTYIPADGSVTTTLDIYIEDDLGDPITGLVGGLSIVEDGTTDSGAVFTDLGGGNYTAVYSGSAAGQYTLSVVYDFAGTPQTLDDTVVVDVSEFVEFVWLGINTEGNNAYANEDVDVGAMWQNVHTGTTGTVPGAGALAKFDYTDESGVPSGTPDNFWNQLLIGPASTFNPDAMVFQCNSWTDPHGVPLYVLKDLTIDSLTIATGYNASNSVNQFIIGSAGPSQLARSYTGAAWVRWYFRYNAGVGSYHTEADAWVGTITITGPTGGPIVYDTADYLPGGAAGDLAWRADVNANTATTGVQAIYSYRCTWLATNATGASQSIKVELSEGANGPKYEYFGRPADGLTFYGMDDVVATLNLAGDQPITFGANDGAWSTVRLCGASKLQFSGADITLQQQNQGYADGNDAYYMRGDAGSAVEFTAVGGTVNLEDPGVRADANLSVPGNTALKVRSDQTWTNTSGLGVIRRAPVNGGTMVEALDALPLNNLDNVPFYLGMPIATLTYSIGEGEYQGLRAYGSGTSGRVNTLQLTGDVALKGYAVTPGNGTATATASSDYSLMIDSQRVVQYILNLGGNDLTAAHSILVADGYSTPSGYTDNFNELRYINASGSTLTVGDDLVIDATINYAGYIQTGTLYEHDRMGITGDVDTVVNIEGSFTTNVRAMDSNYDGLTLSTVNMLGGTVAGSAETMEVTGDADDLAALGFGPGSGAIGTLNIGGAGDEASIQLVNDSLNDNPHNTTPGDPDEVIDLVGAWDKGPDAKWGVALVDDDGINGVDDVGEAGWPGSDDFEIGDGFPDNYDALKDGEVLLVGSLNIVNGQLDLNAQSVLVSNTTLSIGADGILDLAAGVDQVPGVPYTAFAGVGDQTATWDTFKDKVVDNSTIDNQTLTFTSFYDGVNDRTLWKPIGVATGIVSADSAVSATPDSLPALGLSTVQIVLVDTGGWPIVSLVDADFTVGITNSGTKASVVTETVAGVSGVYTFQVTDGVVETVDVDVQVDAGAGDVALNTEPSIDFISVTIETANSTVAYASGAPTYIPADGSVTTTLDIYIEDDLGDPITGLANGLSVVEDGVTDSGAVFTDLGGGNYTAVYSGSAAGQYTLSVVYDFAGTPQTLDDTVVVDVSEYVEYLWLGINTPLNMSAANTNVDTGALWENIHTGTTGAVPGAGDLARFNFNDTRASGPYDDEMFILPGVTTFAPSAMVDGSSANNSAQAPLYILKSMSLNNLHNSWAGTSGSLGYQLCRIGSDAAAGWLRVDDADTGAGEMTGVLTIKSDLLPAGATTIDITGLDDRLLVRDAINAVNATTGVTAVVTSWTYAFGSNNILITRDATGAGKYVDVTTTGLFATQRYFGSPQTYGEGWDAADVTMTLTNAMDPLSFSGAMGGYRSIRLNGGSKIVMDNAAITLSQQPQTMSGNGDGFTGMGGSGGSVEFPAVSGSIALSDPGNRPGGALGVRQHVLKVRSDQTWTNASGLGVIRMMTFDGGAMVEAIDMAPLNNMDAVPFHITLNTATLTYGIPAGEYQGLRLNGDGTTGNNLVQLTGDVVLQGYAVEPGEISPATLAASLAPNSLVLASRRRMALVLDLDENALTVTNSLLLDDPYATRDGYADEPNYNRYINASAATVEIGGDLVFQSTLNCSGYVHTNGLLYEHSRMGITGDATTEIDLEGSFTSNLKAMSAAYNGLTLSTVNMLGGVVLGSAETLEVTGDAADNAVLPATDFDPGTGAIGVLNIGGAGDEAHIQLVNDSLNDNPHNTTPGDPDEVIDVAPADGIPDNYDALKDGEVLLVGSLNIVDGVLDCNGLGVKISSTTLSISGAGILDLNTGAAPLGVGVPYTKFFGVGNQAAVWNAFKAQVGDSTNPTLDFEAAYVALDDKTYWQEASLTETIEVTAVADFNWVYPNTPVTTHTPPWTTYPTPDPAAMPNHYATITIDMTTGGADTYTIVIDQDGGVLTDFSVRDATQLVGWDGAAATTVDVAGGLDTASTPGSYTLNVNVTGDSMGGVNSKPVTMKLRVFADVNDSGSVDTTDKLEINRELNGIAVTAGITPRMLDLTGNSAIDTNDKLQVNRVLNGLLVP
jgi:hypothetical protein